MIAGTPVAGIRAAAADLEAHAYVTPGQCGTIQGPSSTGSDSTPTPVMRAEVV